MIDIVAVEQGRLSGVRLVENVLAFKGIPYAAPPGGRFRFRAPGPPAPWDGIRPAHLYGPSAPQPAPERLWSVPGVDARLLFGGWQYGDEYLNLNVWTPDVGAGGLPVMVFVHGGGFSGGAGSLPLYDGTRLAARGAVVVTANYRLGAEGFLALPGGDANVGLRDLLRALEWVHGNIASFGGDPSNVTLFGESAGASATVLLASAPAARGLIRRVISQSAGISVIDRRYPKRLAERFAELLGIPATRDAFMEVAAERLVATQAAIAESPDSIDLSGLELSARRVNGNTQYTPHVDGELIPDHPAVAFDPGIDLLSGTNRDEMHLYLGRDAVTKESLAAAVAGIHPDPEPVLATYRAALPGAAPRELLSAILSDHDYRVETRAIAQAHAHRGGNVFGYEFGWRSPAQDGRIGAGHVVELPFVFGTVDVPEAAGLIGTAPPPEIVESMQRAWIAFATDGDPGWPRYTESSRRIRRIDVESSDIDDPFDAVREGLSRDSCSSRAAARCARC